MSEEKQLELFDEDVRDKDISSMTRLFRDVKRYRNSFEFQKKLDFYSGFPYLGVYNAALVEQQRPGARLVLTVKKWDELYNRKIKLNARPVIILLPFYPVEFLFDVSDTRPIDNTKKVEENWVIDHLILKHRATCIRDVSFYLHNLKANLPKFGISCNRFVVGATIQSEIRSVTKEESEELSITISKKYGVTHHNYFAISINSYATDVEELALIIHELGHLFCQHIRCPWWDKRFFTKEVKEFEAETVSYLVCKRFEIHSGSIDYLSNYADNHKEIPQIDINCIFDAVDLIEKMIKENMDITKCIMYKKDQTFKEKIDAVLEQIKEEKERQKALKRSY